MKTLTLDLGTKTGWATDASGKIDAGTWPLMSPKEVTLQHGIRFDRRLDVRIPRLWQHLVSAHSGNAFDWVVFEDVQFASTTLQAHLWASLRATVWLFAHEYNLSIECLATGKLKLFAAHHGAATKDMMAAWLVKTRPNDFGFFDGKLRKMDTNGAMDDNAVDAVHLLLWAQKTLSAIRREFLKSS